MFCRFRYSVSQQKAPTAPAFWETPEDEPEDVVAPWVVALDVVVKYPLPYDGSVGK